MYSKATDEETGGGRAPQGARGLKSKFAVKRWRAFESRPARGAWIEIVYYGGCASYVATVAPRKGRVD